MSENNTNCIWEDQDESKEGVITNPKQKDLEIHKHEKTLNVRDSIFDWHT